MIFRKPVPEKESTQRIQRAREVVHPDPRVTERAWALLAEQSVEPGQVVKLPAKWESFGPEWSDTNGEAIF